jgi:hypothetical protein
MPAAEDMISDEDFCAIQVVHVESLSPVGVARAAGLRAARAPFVFMGETHSYLYPEAAETLTAAAIAGGWTVVIPGFENANPRRIFSWAEFLVDYGRWASTLPAREVGDVPLYNALFRRDALLRASGGPERTLALGDEFLIALRSDGGRFYVESAARMSHLNLDSPMRVIHEQFLAGVMIGTQRARRWSLYKRIAYMLGSSLIPLVLFRRNFASGCHSIRARKLSWLVLPAMFLLNIAKAAGEFVGYAGFASDEHEAMMDRYEIHKRDYVL